MEKPYTKEREKTVYKSEVIVRKKDKKRGKEMNGKQTDRLAEKERQTVRKRMNSKKTREEN